MDPNGKAQKIILKSFTRQNFADTLGKTLTLLLQASKHSNPHIAIS